MSKMRLLSGVFTGSLILFLLAALPNVASAQNTTTAQGGGSFMVQCPATTAFHPTPYPAGAPEPDYTGPQQLTSTLNGINFSSAANTDDQHAPYISNGGQIKCQQVSGGDGMMTEADGNQTFMFSFGPLSGLDNIKHGQPGTLLNTDFNNPCIPAGTTTPVNCYYNSPTLPSNCGASAPASCATAGAAGIVGAANPALSGITDPTYDPTKPINTNAAIADPATVMTVGVINGNIPGPLTAFDEDDEMFLTLSNVGMIMRPDLFEQHTIHFHGYPNASSYYDGVPDATWAINIGGSATYYYLAPDAGTYFWHCHITPPEHLQMGMVSQLYVRPRQNRVPVGINLYNALAGTNTGGAFGTPTGPSQQSDLRTACNTQSITHQDILCSVPIPVADNGFQQRMDPFAGTDPRIPAGTRQKYVYNDGDGSTWYDIDVPIQLHGFDPNFHFVGMTFNPEGFSDMKDKYFLLNGRSYPDTVGVPGYLPGLPAAAPAGMCGSLDPHAYTTNPDQCSGAIGTEDTDGRTRFSQPLSTLIMLIQGERAALRFANLAVTEYQTIASLGLPMTMVGYQAKILRDQAGNNLFIKTNSINLGGGESLDAILDSCLARNADQSCATPVPTGTYFLYSPILDRLSNDAENFGGAMTEVLVCSSISNGTCNF